MLGIVMSSKISTYEHIYISLSVPLSKYCIVHHHFQACAGVFDLWQYTVSFLLLLEYVMSDLLLKYVMSDLLLEYVMSDLLLEYVMSDLLLEYVMSDLLLEYVMSDLLLEYVMSDLLLLSYIRR